MIIINKKRIQIILSCVMIGILAFSFQVANYKDGLEENKNSEQQNTVQTAATPVSGKTIVLDAGHGAPDEGAFLLHKENKQLTFYK